MNHISQTGLTTSSISSVIPLYNKLPHIGRALRSVLAQTHPADEIIVVDDGSTDGGGEVVKSFNDARIKLIRQENQGESAARNRGIAESKGELIAFLDADDAWKPEFIETILRLRRNFPNAGAYATAFVFHEGNGVFREPSPSTIPPPPWEGLLPNYFKEMALGGYPISASGVCIPKKIFEKVGDFPVGEKLGGDTDMWCRIALKYQIALSRKVNAIYYRDAVNRVCLNLPENEFPAIRTLREALMGGEVSSHQISYVKECIALLQLDMAKRYALAGKNRMTKMYLLNCETSIYYWKLQLWRFLTLFPNNIIINLINLRNCQDNLMNKLRLLNKYE